MKDDGKFLYCYKMTHDTGFAPNPYHGVLTLATCKPTIRRCAEKGYWISGWAAKVVQGKKTEPYEDKAQRLIYLAMVSDKIPIEKYWQKYPQKRQPDETSSEKGKECYKSCGNSTTSKSDDASFCGDNIYEPKEGEDLGFKRHENPYHGEANKAHDLSGENILVCNEFYYFGIENAIDIINILGIEDFVVPRCKKISLDKDVAKIIIGYVEKNYEIGINQKKK